MQQLEAFQLPGVAQATDVHRVEAAEGEQVRDLRAGRRVVARDAHAQRNAGR